MRRRLRSPAGAGLPDGARPGAERFDRGRSGAERSDRGRSDAGRSEVGRLDRHRAYWRANLRLIGIMLLVWALATFGISFFARDLTFSFFGWPFAFFVGAQGAPVLYLLLVLIYAWRMSVLDRRHGVSDEVAPFDGDAIDVAQRRR